MTCRGGWKTGERGRCRSQSAGDLFSSVLSSSADNPNLDLAFNAQLDLGTINFFMGMPDRGKELYALALETLSKSAKKAEIRQKFETTSSDGSSDSDSDSESEKADEGPDWPAASHDLRISRIKVFLFEGCFP